MILPALSIRQPWAALITLGLKDVENRSWRCPDKYIGRQVLLHAGQRPCPWEPGYSRRGPSMPVWQAAQLAYKSATGQLLPWHICNPMSQGLGLGGIVGVATIIACKRRGMALALGHAGQLVVALGGGPTPAVPFLPRSPGGL